MTQDEAKAEVAKRAVDFVEQGMSVGLGTGTTATMFIRELGKRVKSGLTIHCVASSDASGDLARSLGMNMVTFSEVPVLDIYVDGADEVGPGLALIKGGGGALLREKIVASAARSFVVVADSTKVVEYLGRFPLPVETVQLATPLVARELRDMGLSPKLRRRADGSPYVTDEGNHIIDCFSGRIENPAGTAARIRHIVGVVEHGIFLNMASLALVAGDDGVQELHP
jgi:ribose 5-phosphate isomerase A